MADPLLLRLRPTGKEGGLARQGGLKKLVGANLDDIDAREINSIPIGRTRRTGVEVVVRVGRYGPYVQVGEAERRRSLPEDLAPDELTLEKAVELARAPSGDQVLGTDPTTGYAWSPRPAATARTSPWCCPRAPRTSRRRRRCSQRWTSRRSRSSRRCTLLTLPRALGTAEDGEEVTAQNGRYGPYISKGKESRSLESEEQLLTITLERGAARCSRSPSSRPRRAAAEAAAQGARRATR